MRLTKKQRAALKEKYKGRCAYCGQVTEAVPVLTVVYATKERKYHSACTYSNVQKTIEVCPAKIVRRPCGQGAAAHRYYYECLFAAPDDAEFAWNGLVRSNIVRSMNPGFKPKDLSWAGDVCEFKHGEAAR